MKDSVSEDVTSFFRLPLLFVSAWIMTGIVWIYLILPLLMGGYILYYLYPFLLLNSIVEWIIYSPVLFIATSLLFWHRHFCRVDTRSVIRVVSMAVICFILFNIAGLIQVMVMPDSRESLPYSMSPAILGLVLSWCLKLVIAVIILWLIALPMTQHWYKNDTIFRITPRNNRIIHSVLLTSLIIVSYFLLSVIFALMLAEPGDREEIFQFIIYLLTTGISELLLPGFVIAAILMSVLYRVFGYHGEQLRIRRLLLTGLAGGLIVFIMSGCAVYIVMFSSFIQAYWGPDSVISSLQITGYASVVIAALIIRYIVKRVFRADQEALHAENN